VQRRAIARSAPQRRNRAPRKALISLSAHTVASRCAQPRDSQQTQGGRNTMRIDQLMSKDVQYCGPNDTPDVAARLMWENDCGCVPVCTGDGSPRVVGIVTDRDICMSALFGGKPLAGLRVADAMSREIHICRATDSPVAVERIMRDRQIRRV